MNNSLIIIGKGLLDNKPFMDYTMRNLEEQIGQFDSIKILNKNDNDFFIQLEDCIKKFDQTIILAHSKNYNFVNKIIATLNEDNLELKDGMLIPKKTVVYSNNSYLLEFNTKTINVLSITENENLPEILLGGEKNSKTFTIIDIDIDSITLLLEPICTTYEVSIDSTPIVEGWISVRATAYKYGDLDNFIKAVKSLFVGKFINTQNTIKYIIKKLEENSKKITAVESCTGGLICSLITKEAGASNVFDGGIVSYANEIKESWLGVDRTILQNYGAVSEFCVINMLEGALQASKADFALATSGIAGPSGGSDEKPVGTVFVGVKQKGKDAVVQRLLLKGDRRYIQIQSAFYAFKMLLQDNKKLFF